MENLFEQHLLIDWFLVFKKTEIIETLKKNKFKNIQAIKHSINEDERIKIMSNFYRMEDLELGEWPLSDMRGKSDFLIYKFEDHDPNYNYRDTSKSNRLVNINTFDLKVRLREETKSLIHMTDNIQETKDNLRVLNLYEKCYKQKKFNNLKEVFETLNEIPGLEWLVLRNFEDFPNLILDEHADVDLLVNNFYLAKNALDANAACKVDRFEDGDFRVLQKVIIDDKEIDFDLRSIGDGYYDAKWQKDMLASKVLNKNFYIPERNNYLNSLLYHALIHKKEIHSSYSRIFNSFNLPKGKLQKWEFLNKFLEAKNYSITKPEPSVFYIFQQNHIVSNLEWSKLICPAKNIITSKILCENESGQKIYSRVYEFKGIFIKQTSLVIGQNERNFLKILDHPSVPKLLKYREEYDSSILEIQKVQGLTINQIINSPYKLTDKDLIELAIQIYDFLKYLHSLEIHHRDLNPDNLIWCSISKRLFILDFGWAISKKYSEIFTPKCLGAKEGFYGFIDSTEVKSDNYSAAIILSILTKDNPLEEVEEIISKLIIDEIASNNLNLKLFLLSIQNIQKLNSDLQKSNSDLQKLNSDLQKLNSYKDKTIIRILNSNSWKITLPLRKLNRISEKLSYLIKKIINIDKKKIIKTIILKILN